MRRWSGPGLFVQVLGNTADPRLSGLVERARVYAGHLFALMRHTGQRFRFEVFREPDGSVIVVNCHAGQVKMVQARIVLAGATVHAGVFAAYAMNSGWLRWELGDTPNYTVYTDADEMTEFVIPGSSPERTERWSGKMTSYDTDTACQANQYLPHWLEQPTLGTDLEYTPVETTVNVADDPSLYTGLVKLWAQSVIGSGKTIASKLPTGWSSDPKYLGMVREPLADVPTGEAPKWYLVQATSAGCWVAPLVLKTPAQCMARWIANGDLTGAALLRAEAWIFAVATVGEAVQIADSTAMADAYGDGGQWIWGWYWAEQKLGTAGQDEAKAVTVVAYIDGAGVDWRIHSNVARLAISWTDRVPVVTASAETEASWTPGYGTAATLYIPTSATEWGRLVPPSSSAPTGSGPVVAWFDESGAEQVASFSVGSSYSDSGTDPVESYICGVGSRSSGSWSHSGSTLGWDVPGSTVSQAVHSEVVDNTSTTATTAGSITSKASGYPGSWNAANCSSPPPNTYCWNGEYYSGLGIICDSQIGNSITTTTPSSYSWPTAYATHGSTVTTIGHNTHVVSGSGSNILAPLITPGHILIAAQRQGTYTGSNTFSYSGSITAVILEQNCYGNTVKHRYSGAATGTPTAVSGSWAEFNAELVGPTGVLYTGETADADDWSWLTPDSSSTPREGICQVKASYGSNYYKAINDTATIANVDPAALGAQGFWVGAI